MMIEIMRLYLDKLNKRSCPTCGDLNIEEFPDEPEANAPGGYICYACGSSNYGNGRRNPEFVHDYQRLEEERSQMELREEGERKHD